MALDRSYPAAVLVTLVLLAGRGEAGGRPDKTARLELALVTAYEECTAPNVVVSDAFPVTGANACAPPVRSDPTCGFGPDGAGDLRVVMGARGVRVRVRLEGLDAGCEGAQLYLVPSARATTGACAGGVTCTVQDADSGFLLPARPCFVADGRCEMGGALPVEDLPAEPIELALRGVAVERAVGPSRIRTFEAGLRPPLGPR